MDFNGFPKIARLSRNIAVTEKIDGTNAQVNIRLADDGLDDTLGAAPFLPPYDIQVEVVHEGEPRTAYLRAGSRTRWISTMGDNHGFAGWVYQHAHELAALGVGAHFGEWWGAGIQRRYGLTEKRFSLFNVNRWFDHHKLAAAPKCFELLPQYVVAPECCYVVPVLYAGPFVQEEIEACLGRLEFGGSVAAPGFDNPEGIVVYHEAARTYFKKTIDRDDEWKGKAA
jgi:hypothetical protein